MFDRIPEELKQYPQWVNWSYEERDGNKPTKVPYQLNGKMAMVTEPSHWTDFDSAVHAVELGQFDGIGFVLTNDDPYAFIDLDDTKGDQKQHQRQQLIFQQFDSYAERSPSGSGLHIIVKGSVKHGRRRENIEVYSSERYMTMTGDVYRDAPIIDKQALLTVLWEQLDSGRSKVENDHDAPETMPDDDVIEKARTAANGDKFSDLFDGDWQKHYGSQSEADFAIINIFAFYTQNRAQITRLFHRSALGQRQKAKRKDYLAYMLNRCFDRMLPPVDTEALQLKMLAAIEAANKPKKRTELGFTFDASKVDPETGAESKPIDVNLPKMGERQIGLWTPPGLLGDVAEFIYRRSTRPVREIALAGAIGLLAGICGRGYNVNGTGLNQYVLLLAKTGTGKESIAGGIDAIMEEVEKTVPTVSAMRGPSEIASVPALHKHLSKHPVFYSIVGEFGMRLKEMTNERNAVQNALMRMLMDVYGKSGRSGVLHGSIYSSSENNAKKVTMPALTIIGESTPERFYGALDETMVSSGLLPRFLTIEYESGIRPPTNQCPQKLPSFELVERMVTLVQNAERMANSVEGPMDIGFTDGANAMQQEFDKRADAIMNSSNNEVLTNLWNRAHLKVLKLAALVAVGINPNYPVIDENCVSWAIEIVARDVHNIKSRFENGEVGKQNDDKEQIVALAKIVGNFIKNGQEKAAKYGVTPEMYNHGIMTYRYLLQHASSRAAFKNNCKAALGSTLIALEKAGDIRKMRVSECGRYNYQGELYAIVNPQSFVG